MAENEAAKLTHVILRPPPGTRFSIWGSDVRLDFQKGKEREIVNWLHKWIDSYIEPIALKAELKQKVSYQQVLDENGFTDKKVLYANSSNEVETEVPPPEKIENVPTVKVVVETEEVDINDVGE